MKYVRTFGVLTTILICLSNLLFSKVENLNLQGSIVSGALSNRLLAVGVNSTTTGSLNLNATYESMSVYAGYSGDENANNRAQLYYRVSGAGEWLAGMAMTVDRRSSVTSGSNTYPNPYVRQWRASLIGLQSNQLYEVKVVFSDADGVAGRPS